MRAVTQIPRRNEGKTWRVVGPLSGGYLKIEMLLKAHNASPSYSPIRVMPASAYKNIGQYPMFLPVYKYTDYLAEAAE